ncbi:hypothetical protein A2U01_0011705 [Trifolium medium]|uniref:Uncharacterized protein n=1 Tax=Trifolium medium TaxID=97028 RepID=A0A392MU34_9FABA|nr:hypothetical protein [Trifolium medium]
MVPFAKTINRLKKNAFLFMMHTKVGQEIVTALIMKVESDSAAMFSSRRDKRVGTCGGSWGTEGEEAQVRFVVRVLGGGGGGGEVVRA